MVRFFTPMILLLAAAISSAGQNPVDAGTVLNRSKTRLQADLERLPRYTCVQTVTRHYFYSPYRFEAPSCKEAITAHDKRNHELQQSGWDRLRLDVAVASSHEIYSWVGAPRFEDDALASVAGGGPLGSGDFGPFIGGIFKGGILKLEGEKEIEGRRMLEYSYEVPEASSKYEVNAEKQKFITGYSGTMLFDEADPDLIRLVVRTGELREESGKCQAISEVDYGRTMIHGRQMLIPKETRLRVIGRDGGEALNVTAYSDCHEYSSKSVVLTDGVEPPQAGAPKNQSQQPAQTPFPPGLHFDWRLLTPIDSDNAAAGDPVEAILRAPLRDKKGAILAPAGSRLHGRLGRFAQHAFLGGYFEVEFQFEFIDLNGQRVPLSAQLQGANTWLPYRGRMTAARDAFASAGASYFFTNPHLKLDRLDSRGVTTLPNAGKKENAADTSKNAK